jgi:hypothetical protein
LQLLINIGCLRPGTVTQVGFRQFIPAILSRIPTTFS